MTEIERKALALVNGVRKELGYTPYRGHEASKSTWFKALCSAIEQHEAEKAARAADREQHEAFRQEVSDAVEESIYTTWEDHPSARHLTRFIIPKSDTLVEALKAIGADWPEAIDRFRAALAARGLKIVEDK